MWQIVTRDVEKIEQSKRDNGQTGWAYCSIDYQGAAPESRHIAAECEGTRGKEPCASQSSTKRLLHASTSV